MCVATIFLHPMCVRLQLLLWVMESRSLGLKTLLCIERVVITTFSEFLTPILFIPHCAMSFFFQLGRWDGTLTFPILCWRIRQVPIRGQMSPWRSTSAIASMFAPLNLTPTISFLLAGSFRLMSVSLGQLLSSTVLHNLPTSKTISGWTFIKA